MIALNVISENSLILGEISIILFFWGFFNVSFSSCENCQFHSAGDKSLFGMERIQQRQDSFVVQALRWDSGDLALVPGSTTFDLG